MPRLEKLLSRFDKKERAIIESLIEAIISLNWKNLDIKRLTGYKNFFRVRKGEIRIIFAKDEKDISILMIGQRREDMYKF